MSSKMGYGDKIAAKWKSIVRHVTNKHENHPGELFSKCAHDELDDLCGPKLVRNDFHSFILKLLNCPNSLIQYLPLFC